MPNHLHTLCEVKWPPVEVGWPPEDTMNLKILEAVYTVVTGGLGHLDPYPYRAGTPGSISVYGLMARLSSRPSSLDELL